MTTETVYVALLDEDVKVWRPVEAERLSDGLYRLIGETPDDEKWEFKGGSVVQCHYRQWADGERGLVAYALGS